MSLPEQIQKQVEVANSIIEQHYGTGADTDAVAVAETKTPETQQATEVEAPAAGSGETHSAGQEVTPADDENNQTYAQRWRSLQGVYNSEVRARQHAEQRIQQLEGLIATMSAPPAPVQAPAKLVTDADRETFGDDMLDFTARAVSQATAPLTEQINALQRQLQQFRGVVPVVQQVQRTQAEAKEERFSNALTQAVPDWERVNVDTRFHEWLLTPDPMTGILRQTYLEDAHQRHDVGRVAFIFNSWKELTGKTSRPNPVSTAASTRSELERQIAPGRSTAAPTPVKADVKTYTRADITELYDRKRKGEFADNEAEFKALEKDIFAAMREGRVT